MRGGFCFASVALYAKTIQDHASDVFGAHDNPESEASTAHSQSLSLRVLNGVRFEFFGPLFERRRRHKAGQRLGRAIFRSANLAAGVSPSAAIRSELPEDEEVTKALGFQTARSVVAETDLLTNGSC